MRPRPRPLPPINRRVDIVGIGNERAIEKAARLRKIGKGSDVVGAGEACEVVVHQVGGQGLFACFGGNELGVQRAPARRDDFVLHVEEIGERLVEPLGPDDFRLRRRSAGR